MIEVDTEREVHSLHILEKHELGLHTISVSCDCKPDHLASNLDNVYLHQRISQNSKNKPAEYETYYLFQDGCAAPKEK